MNNMKVNIEYDSIVDGEGLRAALFVSGCHHNCIGCHNPETHDFDYGKDFTAKLQNDIIDYCTRPYVTGLTLTGGDPMYNATNLLFFVKKFRRECPPDKDIWIYSGFTYEEILQHKEMKRLLDLCDVLVDGRFEIDNMDKTYSFKGSYNQRTIDIQGSNSKSIVIWTPTYM
jgi:anaerobic ribonucleoside-triphosphate reductase activating protein